MIALLGIDFDHHDYDERGDSLYLHVGPPREPARALETPEGHIVEYDEDGAVIGLELLNVRWTLEREGKITLTWPQTELDAESLTPALAVTPGERLYLGRHWPLLSRLLGALRTERAVRAAVVFGSVARGTDHATSDVDLLVSLREPGRGRRAALTRRLERVAARPVQLVTLDEAERTPSLLAEILREGRVLVDRDGTWARLAGRRAEIERAAAREDARLERRARAAVEYLRATP